METSIAVLIHLVAVQEGSPADRLFQQTNLSLSQEGGEVWDGDGPLRQTVIVVHNELQISSGFFGKVKWAEDGFILHTVIVSYIHLE